MENGSGDAVRPLSHRRQVTIDALCEHFANDRMAVEEFERRVELAHRAEGVEELDSLLRDLPGGQVPAETGERRRQPPADRRFRVTSAAHTKEREIVVAIMGGASRRGRWTPARRNFGLAVMGGTELDFREAVLAPGVTEVHVLAVWGGVEIIVPPGMRVESHGMGILGGFEHFEERPADDFDAPTLRITGFALMGGVEITQRYPGESAREARRRRRLEGRERARLGRGE